MKRPFGVTLLAILALLGTLAAIYHSLQLFGLLKFFPFGGQVGFYYSNYLGAIMWIILALIYIWVFRLLWSLNPTGWLFVVVLSALNLILAVASILGQSTAAELLPAIVVNGLILIYGLLPGTKQAFNVQPQK